MRAASEKFGKLALLHFDSHQDSTKSETKADGTRNLSHANFAYDLQEEGCIDPARSAQVFIRTGNDGVRVQCDSLHGRAGHEAGRTGGKTEGDRR